MTLRWNIGEWSSACGPRPQEQIKGAETVNIEQRGSELTIRESGRVYSTTSCYEALPGLVRRTHSSGQRNWGNLCVSAPGDARQATVRTNLRATADRIDFSETAQYEFGIAGQRCTASSGRWRTYRLLERAGGSPLEAEPEDTEQAPTATILATESPVAPDTATDCQNPGAPVRLEVFPSSKLLQPGDSLEFKAIARDQSGCEVVSRPRYTLREARSGVRVSTGGKLQIDPESPEGHVVVDAKLGAVAAQIQLEIVSQERYASLLRTPSDEAPLEEAAATPEALPSQLGARNASAEDTARQRKWLFLSLAGMIALALAAAGFWLLRKNRGHRPETERNEGGSVPKESASRRSEAPAATRERRGPGPRGRHETRYYDGRERIPSGPDLRHLPHTSSSTIEDDAELASRTSQTRASAGPKADPQQPGRVCPTCGAVYAANMKFCGEDGTALLPIN